MFTYSEKDKEMILFLEENGFIWDNSNFFRKEIENKILVLVSDRLVHTNKILLRIFYSDRFPRMSDSVFIIEFDEKLFFDLCNFSKKIVDKTGFNIVSYSTHYKNDIFDFFSNEETKIKYVNEELAFV